MVAGPDTKIGIFISYARKDIIFARELSTALDACGFSTSLDEDPIDVSDKRVSRITERILAADTIIAILSPDSIQSEHCLQEWEVAQVNGKRLLSVKWRPLPDDTVPPVLARPAPIAFFGANTFANGLSQLVGSLQSGAEWVVQHTRLSRLAAAWIEAGKPPSMLLEDTLLHEARNWLVTRPHTGPRILESQREFIQASMKASHFDHSGRLRKRTQVALSALVLALAFAGAGVLSALQWMNSAAQQRKMQQAINLLEAENNSLEIIQARLNAKIALDVVTAHEDTLHLPAGWYPAAASLAGAIGYIEYKDLAGRIASRKGGFLMDGALLTQALAGQAFILTSVPSAQEDGSPSQMILADFKLHADQDEGPPKKPPSTPYMETAISRSFSADTPAINQTISAQFTFTGLDASPSVALAERVWRSSDEGSRTAGFEIYRIQGDAPAGARAIKPDDVDCSAPYTSRKQGPSVGLFDMHMRKLDAPGSGGAPRQISLQASRLIENINPYAVLYSFSSPQAPDLQTDHTLEDLIGAPVFDLKTGRIMALHLGVEPDITANTDTLSDAIHQRQRGYGVAVPVILEDARRILSGADALPPLCAAPRAPSTAPGQGLSWSPRGVLASSQSR